MYSNKFFKKAGFILFVLLFFFILATVGFCEQKKEEMNMKSMMVEKGAIPQIDSIMVIVNRMMNRMMEKGMAIDTASGKDTYKIYKHKINMHKMMSSMQNMMQGMKDFMGVMDSAMKDQEMTKDIVMKKNIQEMQETMEHMSEHLPGLMENIEKMIKRMEEKK